MTAISRYETALDRALQRALMTLERQQARRRGEDVPPPLAIEVTAPLVVESGELAPPQNENFQTKPIFAGESASLPAADATIIETQS